MSLYKFRWNVYNMYSYIITSQTEFDDSFQYIYAPNQLLSLLPALMMLQPALLISGLGHVSGCHLPPLLISQLTFKPSSLGSRAHKKIVVCRAHNEPTSPVPPLPLPPTATETSAILWLSIISNILCDSRATLWHFVRNTRCLVGLSACVFGVGSGFCLCLYLTQEFCTANRPWPDNPTPLVPPPHPWPLL